MRAKFKIADAQLALGPTNINETLPQDGEFKPSRGKAIVLPGVYYNGSRVINREQQWVWDLLIEDTATFNALEALAFNGNTLEMDTMYGEDLIEAKLLADIDDTQTSFTLYGGNVFDINLDLPLKVDSEYMAVSSATVTYNGGAGRWEGALVVERGQEGSTNVSHTEKTAAWQWTSYSGQVSDCIFELHEGLVFKGNKRGYRCTLVVNCHD